MKKPISFLLIAVMLFGLSGCGDAVIKENTETFAFTDSCGRVVRLPVGITKVAPSGIVAQMIMTTIAPELLVGLSATPGSAQAKYLPDYYMNLPTFGQFYGTKATLNMEALIAAGPQVIIDMGDMKENHGADMDAIQKQTGLPTIFIETSLDKFAEAYRALGKLLGKAEVGERLAAYCENTIATAEKNAAAIPEGGRLSVMYASGSTGLNCFAKGSIQADVVDIVGAENAILMDNPSGKGTGDTINMEQLYLFDPDVIILNAGGPFQKLGTDSVWSRLSAVENGAFCEIPNMPYNWMSNPPSVNRLLGIWWLGNLLYPEIYDYDIKDKAMEFYDLFWHYELSDGEAEALLVNSSFKSSAG